MKKKDISSFAGLKTNVLKVSMQEERPRNLNTCILFTGMVKYLFIFIAVIVFRFFFCNQMTLYNPVTSLNVQSV